MKKIIILMMMTFLAIGVVSAMSTTTHGEGMLITKTLANLSGTSESNIVMNGSTGKVRNSITKLQGEGKMILSNGKVMEFSQEGKKIQLKTGELTAKCEGCDLKQENGKLMVKMSNGQNTEIKVMPDQANERALKRLQLKNCGENCSIELKEVGKGNESKMAYEIKAQKKSRIFGIFKADMTVEAIVDAETGNVIESKKPWWAFLASEKE